MNREPKNHWSMKTALEQIEKCDFACEGGALSMNDAWIWLKGAAERGPEFWPGQGVWFEVEADAGGVKLRQWTHFYITGCAMSSDTDRRFFTYTISRDPPAPYHYGTDYANGIKGSQLRLVDPSAGGEE